LVEEQNGVKRLVLAAGQTSLRSKSIRKMLYVRRNSGDSNDNDDVGFRGWFAGPYHLPFD
jgi:hypothetical protein